MQLLYQWIGRSQFKPMAPAGDHSTHDVSDGSLGIQIGDMNRNHADGGRGGGSGFLRRIGAQELFSTPMWRAAVTEMVATACLIFALTATLISGFESGQTDPKLLVPVFIFISGFPLLVVTVPLTGGHMNPVFTFAVALKGGVSAVRAVYYVVAQCVGSLIAFAVVKLTMDGGTADKYQLGGCAVDVGGSGVGPGTALALEFSCTFMLLYVAMPILEERRRKELGLPTVCAVVAVAYGLVVYVSMTVTGRAGYAGVGLHPARCWAAAMLFEGSLWEAHWVFWVGPFSACVVYHVFSLALPREEWEKANTTVSL